MKALVIHGPGDYRVENAWPDPRPRPGWALVRVRFAGICGSDLVRFGRTGSYHHPMILGHEFSGTVATPAPKRFTEGDPVAVLPIIPCGDCPACHAGEPFHCSRYLFLGSRIDGGFAEYCLVPEENLFPLPSGLDLRVGAFIEPIAVALHVVRRSGFRPGGSALVLGAGSIGLLIGLWLRVFAAARVVVADVRPESLETARRLGFGEVVDAREMAPIAADGSVTPGFGEEFDTCYEAAGSGAALEVAIGRARAHGTVAVVGRDPADTRLPQPLFERLMRKELSFQGCWGYNLTGEHAFVHGTLAEGRFPVQEMISREVPVEESPALIRAMLGRSIYTCKALLAF